MQYSFKWVNRMAHLRVKGQKSNALEICCYTCYQEGEKKRWQAIEVCQSHKGNDLHPSRRLGKHGTCRSRQEGLTALKVGSATSKAANYRGVSMNMALPIVAGFSLEDLVSYPNAYPHVKTWIEEFKAQKKATRRPPSKRWPCGHLKGVVKQLP